MLSLTPPALHSLHSICSGGVLVSEGALGLGLDACMCRQGGEVSWSNKWEFYCLIFERTKNLLCTGLWECIHVVRVALVRVRGKCISVGVSALFNSWFSFRFWHDCVESCLCLWEVMPVFDRLRRAVAIVWGNRSLLGQVTCSCFFRVFVTCSSSLLLLCSSLFLFLLVRLWCVDNALIKGEIEECWVLYPACDE